MLPSAARLRTSADFAAATRLGSRGSSENVVVHLLPTDRPGSPRAGFVVSRKVGNSVVRHRVTRRLRPLVVARLDRLAPGTDLIVRALPASGRATSVTLGADLDTCLAAALRRAARAPGSAAAADRRAVPRSSTAAVPLTAAAAVAVTAAVALDRRGVLVRCRISDRAGDGSVTGPVLAGAPVRSADEVTEPAPRGSLLARALILPIRGYQTFISPALPPTCRYYPSCSAYAVEALRVHGAVKGMWLAIRRIARCHPWHWSGYDPVPPRKPRRGGAAAQVPPGESGRLGEPTAATDGSLEVAPGPAGAVGGAFDPAPARSVDPTAVMSERSVDPTAVRPERPVEAAALIQARPPTAVPEAGSSAA